MSFDHPNTSAGFDTAADAPADSSARIGRRSAVRSRAATPADRRLAIATAVIAAAALRAFDVNLMSLWTDEGLSFYRAGLDVRGILAGEIPLNALITRDVQPPTYFLLLAGWLRLLGDAAGAPISAGTPISGGTLVSGGTPIAGATLIFAAKWLSILASLPTVALVWASAKRWAGSRAATWAAWMAALSPVFLWYSHEVRSYTFTITLACLATYTGWRALECLGLLGRASDRADAARLDPFGRTRPALRAAIAWSAIAVAADALLAWTHYLGFFVIGFHALGLAASVGWTWYVSTRRTSDSSSDRSIAESIAGSRPGLVTRLGNHVWLLAGLVLVALAASPLVPYAVQRLGTGAEKDQRFYPLWVMARDGLRDFALGRAVDHTGLGWRLAWVWVAMAALLLLGAWRLWQRRPAAAIVATGWLVIPTIAFFALTLIQPRYQGVRHILLQSPPYYILVAAGIAALGRIGRSVARAQAPTHLAKRTDHADRADPTGRTDLGDRSDPTSRADHADHADRPTRRPLFSNLDPSTILPLLAGAVALGGMAWADHAYHVDPTFHKDDLRGLADHVRRRALPGDALVLSDPVLEHVFAVYDPGIPITTAPPLLADGRVDDRPVREHLDPIFEAHERVWFMTPHDDVLAWLEDNANIVQRTAFRGLGIPVRVEAWQLPPDLGAGEGPPQSRPLALGALELLGWEVKPRTLVAGRAGRVDLAWLVRQRGGDDLKVALRLLDAQSVDWADGDHEPFHGLMPTSGWPFGEVVVEPHDLHVSPAAPLGRYTLAVTVYNPATGEVIPSDGPYPIGEVFVAPPDDPAAITQADLPIDTALKARLLAAGGGVEIVGWRGPPTDEPLLGGAVLPVEIWLRAGGAGGSASVDELDDPDGATGDREVAEASRPADAVAAPTTLRLELLDRVGRVIRSTTADVAWDGARPGDPRVARPRLDLPAEAGDYTLRIRVDTAEGSTAWMIAGSPIPFPHRGLWLSDVRIVAPRRLTDVPEMARRLDVMVGERIELLGADLPVGSLPLGEDMPVTLWWRAARTPDIAYHATLQVLAIDVGDRPTNAPVAQHDGIPASGTRPTTGWASGEVIRDDHVLRMPEALPPGRYALIAALYDPTAPGTRRPLVRQAPYGDTRDYVVLGVYTIDMLAPDAAGEPPIRR